MQKKRILRLCCAVLMVSLSACEYEDDFPAGVGEGNIEAIVLNEGRIGTNMGAISVLYRNGMVSPDVFRVVNNRPLGDVAQSITMINGKYFIALNNSKKIEIVNSKTFESEGTILYTQAGLPRQIVAISDTTAIVSDLLSNNVSGVDLPSQLVRIRTVPPYGTPLEYIVIRKWVEYMEVSEHKLLGITAKGVYVFALQFSLMGARDLSAINTPPPNRYPIITTVTALDDDILREAVNFELSRGGQVFIVNNRIEQLFELENQVRRLVPDARTVIGHGQMASDKLEKTIMDFAAHEYDVLLATTIIESGIDMPNVNTIIINNAQNFGLSELHQLRGRVGRSNRKAFCYLLVPPHIPLSPVSRRRLQAIESFSDLGSGIHIAMQDLDIRGAGNLLGAEQSGFIADLGYETYQKILREAVLELKTEEFADTFADEHSEDDKAYVSDCTIESDLEILFPATFVPQESERILLYQELDNMEREADVQAFCKRLEDRFGKIPHEVRELILIVSLRRLARSLGIEKINLKQGKMILYFVPGDNLAYYQSAAFGRILNYWQQNSKRSQLRENDSKRSMVIDRVGSVHEAVDILKAITQLPTI